MPTGEGQRRVALQRRVTACRVVIRLELSKLAFQITRIPGQFAMHTSQSCALKVIVPQVEGDGIAPRRLGSHSSRAVNLTA